MVKLNGWKRIGIIASVVWILVAWLHTYGSEFGSASRMIAVIHVTCDANLGNTKEGFDECNKEAEDSLALATTNARLDATLAAFVPVPLGWGFGYLVLFLVRWVKRGFGPAS